MIKIKEKFSQWVINNGGQILAVTNPYELVRFRGRGQTHVVYKSKGLRIGFSSEDCAKAFKSFQRGGAMRLAERDPKYSKSATLVANLIERDGNTCVYCEAVFCDELPPTLEHFVGRSHGGPDHMSNYALACEPCNKKVGNLPVVEKIKFIFSGMLKQCG